MDIQYVSPQLTPNHYENQEGEHQKIMKKLLLNFRDLIIILNIKFRMIKELVFFPTIFHINKYLTQQDTVSAHSIDFSTFKNAV